MCDQAKESTKPGSRNKIRLSRSQRGVFGLSLVIAQCLTASAALAQSAPSDYTSGMRYDGRGRVTGTISPDPDGGGSLKYIASRTKYDVAGKPILAETGELSAWQADTVAPKNWTGFTILSSLETSYDNMGRKIKEVAKGSDGIIVSVTQFSYDALSRLDCTVVRMNSAIFASPPASACSLGTEGGFGPDRITKNIYDAAGQVLRVQKAVGTLLQQDYVTYTYSSNAKQASVKDANGNLATLTYDGHDRQTRWTFPSQSTVGQVNPADYEEYGYDPQGNRTSLRKRDGSVITYQYDALNRNTVKVVPERAGLSATHTRDIYYGYDLRGLQTFAAFDAAVSGEGMYFTYDGFGRLQTTWTGMDGQPKQITKYYDKNGNPTDFYYPDGNRFGFSYDGLNRMNAIGLNAPVGLTAYEYNSRGLRSLLASGSYTYYGYDAVGRLNGLTQDITGTAYDMTYGYGYNPASQMITRSTSNDAFIFTGEFNVNRTYAVNGLNQYTSAGPATFSYDANGNLTGDGSSAYVYDIENRLVSATGATTVNLRYDPLGRLYETSGGSAGTTRFLYDGDELIAEYDGSGNMLRRYVHGSGVDDPMAWFEGPSVSPSVAKLIKTNHQGSVVALTDWNGNLANINSYNEWGIPASTNVGRFQYTGQAWMPELGMYHYKARIYSPTLGRFLQTDPIGYKDQMNLYAYVGNDPVNAADPYGQREIWVGGMLDDSVTGLVEDAVAARREKYPNRIIEYFSWTEREDIATSIHEAQKNGEPVVVVGHSYGGTEAYRATQDDWARDRKIDLLITLDPVGSYNVPGKEKRDNISTFLNAWANPKDSYFDDYIADVGGQARSLGRMADWDLETGWHHGSWINMMNSLKGFERINSIFRACAGQGYCR